MGHTSVIQKNTSSNNSAAATADDNNNNEWFLDIWTTIFQPTNVTRTGFVDTFPTWWCVMLQSFKAT